MPCEHSKFALFSLFIFGRTFLQLCENIISIIYSCKTKEKQRLFQNNLYEKFPFVFRIKNSWKGEGGIKNWILFIKSYRNYISIIKQTYIFESWWKILGRWGLFCTCHWSSCLWHLTKTRSGIALAVCYAHLTISEWKGKIQISSLYLHCVCVCM